MKSKACSTLLAAAALVVVSLPSSLHAQTAHPNVLFIAVDDLNHWVGHLGRNRQVQTPNIDRLADRGVTFTHAYCAAPACNPSRAALMSGLRPSTSGVYINPTDWRPLIPESLTLPTHFRKNGYYVAGAGKIYHGGFARRSEWDDYFKPNPASQPKGRRLSGGAAGAIKFARLEGGDEIMPDHHVVNWTIEQLGRGYDKPFFLACGLFRPHLPWNVPQKYFDLYPLDTIQLPPFREDDLEDIPAAGKSMARPEGDHANITSKGLWKQAIQGYLASISFADAQIGRLLEALDQSAHRDNTIVVLWGDHGWHLGEKQHWRKFALWEEATRAPLIWVAPGVTKPHGVCTRTVDFMSIYPTLTDLCGLTTPSHVEGVSIRKLLANPSAEWSRPALTTYGFQNHALRTEQWRYIRYANGDEEFYDEAKDPFEWANLAGNSDIEENRSALTNWFPKENKPAPAATKRKNRANRRANPAPRID